MARLTGRTWNAWRIWRARRARHAWAQGVPGATRAPGTRGAPRPIAHMGSPMYSFPVAAHP
eukprot:9467926-Pyramimonas_sp.AAC.1